SKTLAYHITNRANNKEWFYIPIKETWKIFCEILSRASRMYGAEIHTFVLMSNHYHLLVTTPLGNLDLFMRYFQTEACRAIQERAARKNHVFGGRYKWTILGGSAAVAYAYKYILRNPVRARIAENVESYPYSSFTSLSLLKSELPISER